MAAQTEETKRKVKRTKRKKKKQRVIDWIIDHQDEPTASLAKRFNETLSWMNNLRSELIKEGKIKRRAGAPGTKRKTGPVVSKPGRALKTTDAEPAELIPATPDLPPGLELSPELLEVFGNVFSPQLPPEALAIRALQARNTTSLAHLIELNVQTLEQTAKEDALRRGHEIDRLRLVGSLLQDTALV